MKQHRFLIIGSILVGALWLFEIIFLHRPYWILETDVEMDFLFRGLAVSRGLFFDHAFGVPVDILGGLILRVAQIDLHNIERFFPIAYGVGLIGLMVGVLLMAKHIMKTIPLVWGLSALLLFFLHPSARAYMQYWSAEMFVFPLGCLAIICFRKSLEPTASQQTYLWTGLSVGLLIALKTYFIMLAVACAMVYVLSLLHRRLPKFPSWLAYVMGLSIGSFFGLLAFMNNPRNIIGAVLFRARVNSISDLFSLNFSVLIFQDRLWLVIFGILTVVLLVTLISMVRKKEFGSPLSLFMAAMLLSMVLTTAAALIQVNSGTVTQPPGFALRFFLPVALFMSFGLAALGQYYAHLRLRFAALFMLILMAITGVRLFQDFSFHQVREEHEKRDQMMLASVKKPNTRLLLGDLFVPSVALHTGDQYSRVFFADEIRAIFPREEYKNFAYPLEISDIRKVDELLAHRYELDPADQQVTRAMDCREQQEFIFCRGYNTRERE